MDWHHWLWVVVFRGSPCQPASSTILGMPALWSVGNWPCRQSKTMVWRHTSTRKDTSCQDPCYKWLINAGIYTRTYAYIHARFSQNLRATCNIASNRIIYLFCVPIAHSSMLGPHYGEANCTHLLLYLECVSLLTPYQAIKA